MSADTYPLGALVPLSFAVLDDAGDYVDAASTLTVLLPDGSSTALTPAHVSPGPYTASFPTTQTGVHVARLVAAGVNGGAAEDVFVVAGTNLAQVTTVQLRAYLGDTSASDGDLVGVLAAERAAQARVCRVDPFTADLREALLRRVARNLAARAVPVASFSSFDGAVSSTRVPAKDPEIERFESPYRRLTVG